MVCTVEHAVLCGSGRIVSIVYLHVVGIKKLTVDLLCLEHQVVERLSEQRFNFFDGPIVANEVVFRHDLAKIKKAKYAMQPANSQSLWLPI